MLPQPDCPGNKAVIRTLVSFKQIIIEHSSVCFEDFIYCIVLLYLPEICAGVVRQSYHAGAYAVTDGNCTVGGSSISTSLWFLAFLWSKPVETRLKRRYKQWNFIALRRIKFLAALTVKENIYISRITVTICSLCAWGLLKPAWK